MSRCFPFPPPGYESNHVELLAKEKHKEKKHKREKKDKEKREGKEVKDKDKSKDKHKEKKDRKEKHKDKKKDKDRDRDKSRATDDRRNNKQSEVLNEEKLGHSSRKAEDFKFTEELGRRIKNGERDATDRTLEGTTGHIQKRHDNMGFAAITDPVIKRDGNIGITTKMEMESAAGNKMVQEFSSDHKRSLGNHLIPSGEHRTAAGNQFSPNLSNMEQKKSEGLPRVLVADRRTSANEKASKPLFTEQQGNDGLARPLEKIDKRMDGKVKDRDTNNDKRDKHKDKDREEKRDKGKDKDKHKKKEKKEKMSEKGKDKHKEHNKGPESGRKAQVDSLNVKPVSPQKDNGNGKTDAGQDNSRKRNHFQVNGFLPEVDVRPNKLPTAASSHLPLENGRTMYPCQLVASQYSTMEEGAKDAIKAEIVKEAKEHKINGRTDVQAGLNSRPAPTVEIKMVQPPSKPPHPDCKYLSQLYTVPKMDDLPEFDDQEWLFNNKHIQPMPRPELEAEETPQVWAEAMQVSPVDVLALPYVIPY